MRLTTQLAIIALTGAAGYAGWQYASTGAVGLPGTKVTLFGTPKTEASGPAAPAPPPPTVEVISVGTGRVVETREAVGNTRANESIIVASKASGFVEAISFEEGQFVRQGQELLRLESAERKADLDAAAAQIAQAEAQRDEIKQKLDRSRLLVRSQAVTEARIDELDSQLRSAESTIKANEARLKGAQARLDELLIRAPFDGRVGVRQVSVGAFIDAQSRITTLDDISVIKLDFSVPENLLESLKAGSKVSAVAAAYGDRTFNGAVSVIDTRVDPVTRSVRLTAVLPNKDAALRPGMFMNVRLAVATRENAVVVPEEAIVGEGPRQLMFVVKNGLVERKIVLLGQREQGRVEIAEGLAPGETLIVRGVQRVRAGMAVNTRPLPGASEVPAADSRPAKTDPSSAPAPSRSDRPLPAPRAALGGERLKGAEASLATR